MKYQFGRVDSVGETPGYISNPEVKSNSGEGSARGTVCENSETRPLFFIKKEDICDRPLANNMGLVTRLSNINNLLKSTKGSHVCLIYYLLVLMSTTRHFMPLSSLKTLERLGISNASQALAY